MRKHLLIVFLLILAAAVCPAFAASQGPNSPGTVVGVIDPYGEKENIKLSDTLYFTTDGSGYSSLTANLVVGGEKQLAAYHDISQPYTADETYLSMGGAADKWDISLTPAQINDSGFGVEIAVDFFGDCMATNFGFDIPASATIDGVLVETQGKLFYNGGPGQDCIEINHVRMTVYYTEGAPVPTTLRNAVLRGGTLR